MTVPSPDGWHQVASTWRTQPIPPPIGTAPSRSAPLGRRLRVLGWFEMTVGVFFVGLAASALTEHNAGLAWVAAVLLTAQGAAIALLRLSSRRAVEGLLAAPTQAFLVGWRQSCTRHLRFVSGLAALLATEAVALMAWATLDHTLSTPRILARERWWYATLIGLVAVASWLAFTRVRLLATIERITSAERELGDRLGNEPL